MAAILILLFLIIAGIDLWAAIVVTFKARVSESVRGRYWLVVVLVLGATIGMTGYFSYYANPNTHIFGWPIPRIIYQRHSADSPWLDYLGSTIVLAFPMNFILYMLVPSVVFLLIARRTKRGMQNKI